MLLTQACTEPIITSIQPTIVAADIPKNNPKLPPTSETKRFLKVSTLVGQLE